MTKLNRGILSLISFILSTSLYSQKTLESAPLTIGEILKIESDILNEERILNVYLPEGYSENSNRDYPVIYLLDGTINEDFLHVVGLIQFGSFSWIDFVPESIVVGIANIDRKKDFTFPSTDGRDNKEFPTNGHSATFIQFIKQEVIETIESRFRTTDNKTLVGQSLGGLLATEILFTETTMFNKYVIVSPSMWWDAGSLFNKQPAIFENDPSIFIAVGKEGPNMETNAMKLYVSILQQIRDETKIGFSFMPDKDHGDALHLGLYQALEFFNQMEEKSDSE